MSMNPDRGPRRANSPELARTPARRGVAAGMSLAGLATETVAALEPADQPLTFKLGVSDARATGLGP